MNKFLLVAAFVMTNIVCWSQQYVDFKLTPDVSFKTDEGNDYEIVMYEGKSAHEIYQLLATNITSLYNNPSKVMTSVDETTIKIRALGTCFYYTALGRKIFLTGYYQLLFKIKDGKVRVSAPYFENRTENKDGYVVYLDEHVKKMYRKGNLKEKAELEYKYANFTINSIIKSILGLSKKLKEEEDW